MHSDVVLPAATWYEKYDLSMTDMHPFVHAFNQAIPPPWEACSDWDIFGTIADAFADLAKDHLGTRTDVVATPDPARLARRDRAAARQGARLEAGRMRTCSYKTMPNIAAVERDYAAVAEKWGALGPLAEKLGSATKGASWKPVEEVEDLVKRNESRAVASPTAAPSWSVQSRSPKRFLAPGNDQRPPGNRGLQVAGEACRAAARGPRLLARRGADRPQRHPVQPRSVVTSPEWSGIDAHGRRYAPFTINTEHLKPWHTLSGRMHLYLDHEWVLEYGDALPAFRPPLHYDRLLGDPSVGETAAPSSRCAT